MATSPTTDTAALVSACERLVKLLSDRTGIAFTFGYLGNTYGLEGTPRYQDDRRWYAFAAHPGRVGTHKDSIGGVRTDDLGHLITLLQGALELTTVMAQPR